MKDLFIYIIVIAIACIAPVYYFFIYTDRNCIVKINNLTTQIKNTEETINKHINTLNSLSGQLDNIEVYEDKILNAKNILVKGGINTIFIVNGIKTIKGTLKSSDILSTEIDDEVEVIKLYSSKYQLEDFSISIKRYMLDISIIAPAYVPVFDIFINFDNKKYIFSQMLNATHDFNFIVGFMNKKINIKIGETINIYQPQNFLHLYDCLNSKFKQDIKITTSNCLENFEFLISNDC